MGELVMSIADDIKAKQAVLDQAIVDAKARVDGKLALSMSQPEADEILAALDAEKAAVDQIGA
jgi:hypothetical protein